MIAERHFARSAATRSVPRARPLGRRRRPPGRRRCRTSGCGEFGIDARPTQALAVLPDGRALLVFRREAACLPATRARSCTRSARTAARSPSPRSVGDGPHRRARDRRRRPRGDHRHPDRPVRRHGLRGPAARRSRSTPTARSARRPARRCPNPRRAFAPWATPGAARLPAQDRPAAVLQGGPGPRRTPPAARCRRSPPTPPTSRSRSRSPTAARSRCGRPAQARRRAGRPGRRLQEDRRALRPGPAPSSTTTRPTATPARPATG